MGRFRLAFVLCVWSSAVLADQVWTGGDLLATAPLDCAMAPAPKDPMPYQGGRVVSPPERLGKRLRVVNIPKRLGIAYFDETQKGMQEAAAELGSVDLVTEGSVGIDAAAQAAKITEAATHGADGILFSANDPILIAAALKSALAQGIDVIGYDADAEQDARQWFVSPSEPNGIAKALVDQLAGEIGEDGAFAIVTSSASASNQARWISEMAAYAGKCHPGLTWLETAEAGEDDVLSYDQSMGLIGRYPSELKGLLALTSVATPAAAEAVSQAGLCGHVAVVGLATPKAMRSYVESGCVKSIVLWNPIDLGYAALYALRAVADGRLKPGVETLAAGRLGELRIVNGSEILLGAPFVFSATNIGQFKF